MGRVIYQIVKEITAHDDPYKEIKEKSNQLALELLPKLRQKIEVMRCQDRSQYERTFGFPIMTI